MSTPLPVLLPPDTYAKFHACIHCGLCLPACPTYVETLDEADSPRGRILLMKAVADGKIPASPIVFEHLDRCLVCRACEPACPSGVQYHDLIEAVRPRVAQAALGQRMKSRALQFTIDHILPHRSRVAAAMGALSVARKLGLSKVAERFAPGSTTVSRAAGFAHPNPLGERGFYAATAKHRGNVVLLCGCVGAVVSADINAAAIRVLSANGFDVHILPNEPCCGAMAAHANDPGAAIEFAKQTVDALEARGADYYVSPIAGCGAQLKALHHTLRDAGAYAPRAKSLVSRIRDISEFLLDVGLIPPTRPIDRIVTYHDPCHLAHAQRITDPPRQLLALIPGLQVLPLPESDMCCGAAGTYSMNQPAMAAALGRRKAAHIRSTAATEVLTANIGCTLQITRHLSAPAPDAPSSPRPIRVRHVVELLAEAYA